MRSRPFPRLVPSVAALALAGLLAAGPVFADNPDRETDGFYNSAVERADAGDLKGAVIELKNVLQRDPSDLAARVLLGTIYLKAGDGASAAKELRRARRDGARDRFILAPLGRAYLLQGKNTTVLSGIRAAGQDEKTAAEIAVIRGDAHYGLLQLDLAEESYLQALKTRPQDEQALLGLGRTKLAQGDLPAARRYVGWALKANDRFARAWLVKGEIERLERQNEDALMSFSQAIANAPDMADALLGRAGLYIDLGRHKAAQPDVAKVRARNPDNPRAAFLEAMIHARNGESEASEQALTEAQLILKKYPGDFVRSHAPTMLLLGIVSYFAKDEDAAYRNLTRYLARVPRHDGARKILATIALKRGETQNALRLLQPLEAHFQDDMEFLLVYSDALIKGKQTGKAGKMLDIATRIAPPGSAAISQIVSLRLAANQHAQAIQVLKAEIARNPDAVRAALTLATTQLRRRKYQAALDAINHIIERHPDNPALYDLAGGAQLGLRNIDAARASFTKAIALDADYIPALLNLAKLEGGSGNTEKARRHFNTILEKDPENGDVMLTLASLHEKEDDTDGAFRWLDKARTSSRQSVEATLRLINLQLRTGKPEEAKNLARKLHQQDPENLEFLSSLGRALHGTKNIQQAAEIFGRLAERAREVRSLQWLHNAAIWLRRVRDPGAARAALENALDMEPRFIAAHFELFKLEMASRDLDAAMQRANTVARIAPRGSAGDALKGAVYMHQRKFDEAARAYHAAFEKTPTTALAIKLFHARRAAGTPRLAPVQSWARANETDTNAQHLLAIAYADAGQPDKAVAIYEAQLKRWPRNAVLLNNAANLYQKLGDPRALDHAGRAHALAPQQPELMDTYGWILVRNNQLEKGLRLLRNARLRAPDIPEIRYHFAAALNMAGQYAEARRELEIALQSGRLFPGEDDARDLLAKLSR